MNVQRTWVVEEKYAAQMKYIFKGFHRVISEESWQKFSDFITPDEFAQMIFGHGVDVRDWRKCTTYEGYNGWRECDFLRNGDLNESGKSRHVSNVVRWFWEVVFSLSDQDKEDLWTFISGSKGVPPGGFGNLVDVNNEWLSFTIARVKSSTDHLPVSHTCTYQLDLPEYTSKEMLRSRLQMAMQNKAGFGLA
jgi:hypothetical protein